MNEAIELDDWENGRTVWALCSPKGRVLAGPDGEPMFFEREALATDTPAPGREEPCNPS